MPDVPPYGLTPWTWEKVQELLEYAEDQGINVAAITYGRRTCAEQNALYAQGKHVTGARGCRSWHVWGKAVDLYIPGWPVEQYKRLGKWWTSIGGDWGGNWSEDYGHFGWHPDQRIEELCPTGNECPDDVDVWPDDRPPGSGKLLLGLALAAGGVALAYFLAKK